MLTWEHGDPCPGILNHDLTNNKYSLEKYEKKKKEKKASVSPAKITAQPYVEQSKNGKHLRNNYCGACGPDTTVTIYLYL